MTIAARQLRQCRDAIVTELESATFSRPLAPRAVNRPIYNVADLVDLVISVMPRTRVTDVASRQDDEITLLIDVGLQQHFAQGDKDNADSDPLIDLCEEIAEHFARRELTGADGTSLYQCVRTVCGDEESPFYDQDHANTLETFTGVVSLYFVTFREVSPS